MFENNIGDDVSKFLQGENKPVIMFEFSYQNLTFIFIGLLLVLVVSQLIVHGITNK